MDYDNFDIIIGKLPGLNVYPVTVMSTGRTPLSAALTFSDEDDQLRERIQFNENGYLAKPADVAQAGAKLRQKMFPDAGSWATFRETRQHVNAIRGLRIRLNIAPEAAEISRLPWEYCFDDLDSNLYIGLNPQTPIVRVIPTGLERKKLRVDRRDRDRLKVLVAVASPDNEQLAQLYKLRIKERLTEVFEKPKLKRVIDANLVFNATLKKVLDELKKGYDIFQFFGHGIAKEGEGAWLFFEKGDLEQHRVTHERVAQLLQNRVKMCLLTACESSVHDPGDMFTGLAQRLVQADIPAVIGMQLKIDQQAAVDFTENFYFSLTEGQSIDEALVTARDYAYLEEEDPSSWGIPVLYLQSDDGRIWPDEGARQAKEMVEALAHRQRATADEPEEARPKEIDNLLEALSTLGFYGQRNLFRAVRKDSRSAAIVLPGSENAEEYGLGWLIEVLRGELRRSTSKVVRVRNLRSQAVGSNADLLWREAAMSCGVEPGDAGQVAKALASQLETHSLVFVVKYGSAVHLETLLDSFWAKIQGSVGRLPVPGGADQTMILLLIIDEDDELADFEHDLLIPLPPIRRITESVLREWHEEARSLLPETMRPAAVVTRILYGENNGPGLRTTEGRVDDVLENIDVLCEGILEYIGK